MIEGKNGKLIIALASHEIGKRNIEMASHKNGQRNIEMVFVKMVFVRVGNIRC